MFDVIRKLLTLLSKRERRNAYFLLVMVLVMAFLDVIGIASVMPFMAVLANPEVVETNNLLNTVYTALNFADADSFLFFLGVCVFALLVLSIGFKALTTWSLMGFSQMRNYSISRRLVARYLHQPYEWFLSRHSADLGKTILSEVDVVVRNALMPLMHFLAQSSIVIAVLLLLIIVDPFLALVVGGGIGGAYGITYTALRRLLDRIGKDRLAANQARFKAVSDAFGGIKEVKLAALEDVSLERFGEPALRFARAQKIALLAGMMPRYVLEIVAFGGMLLIVLILMRSGNGLQEALPVIALYTLAGYRLMPALQASYNNATKLRFAGAALDQLHSDFNQTSAPSPASKQPQPGLFPFSRIALTGVTYAYPNADSNALTDVCLEIDANKTIGFVGATGSGKTTTIDILLGLLQPTKGELRVDDTVIQSENARAWQSGLGYVPQQIFLSDESIAENIAFGVPREQIDMSAVTAAAKIANLDRFITEDLSTGYDTLIGERGVRLSGGQRQRIGIARALYHSPKVLIFDEATSALDNLTEQAVMEAVRNLEGEVTIVLIAHRLTTVRDCDLIYVLDKGRVTASGTYDELLQSSAQFRFMTSTPRH